MQSVAIRMSISSCISGKMFFPSFEMGENSVSTVLRSESLMLRRKAAGMGRVDLLLSEPPVTKAVYIPELSMAGAMFLYRYSAVSAKAVKMMSLPLPGLMRFSILRAMRFLSV